MTYQFTGTMNGAKNLGRGIKVSYTTNTNAKNTVFRVTIELSQFGAVINRWAAPASFMTDDADFDDTQLRKLKLDFINNCFNGFISNHADEINELKRSFSPTAYAIIQGLIDRIDYQEMKIEELQNHYYSHNIM